MCALRFILSYIGPTVVTLCVYVCQLLLHIPHKSKVRCLRGTLKDLVWILLKIALFKVPDTWGIVYEVS